MHKTNKVEILACSRGDNADGNGPLNSEEAHTKPSGDKGWGQRAVVATLIFNFLIIELGGLLPVYQTNWGLFPILMKVIILFSL